MVPASPFQACCHSLQYQNFITGPFQPFLQESINDYSAAAFAITGLFSCLPNLDELLRLILMHHFHPPLDAISMVFKAPAFFGTH